MLLIQLQIVKYNACTEDVHFEVIKGLVLFLLVNFRRNVTWSPTLFIYDILIFCVNVHCQAKVSDDYFVIVIFLFKQYIFWFYITVNYALGMNVMQSRQYIEHDMFNSRNAKVTLLLISLEEIASVHEIKYQIHNIL